MKQRFSSLDVKIIAHELSASLVSLRVANIYDLSSRIFLFKFAKPEHREQLLVESGYRCHLSAFARSTAATPSAFVTRLRKFLKTRRVTSVRQIGTDRVIEVSFSDGLYHLLLEFYAGGNVILTDNAYNILALLRTVSEGAEHEQFRVGSKYELQHRQNYAGIPPMTRERVTAGLRMAIDRMTETETQNKKFKRKAADALRRALAVSITEYPPVLLDHALQKTGFDKATQPADILSNDTLLDGLMLALDEAGRTVASIVSESTVNGFIIAKSKDQDTDSVMYDDFHPFRPCQFEGQPGISIIEIQGFNKAVDEFFSSIEGQKLESRLQERELNAKRKLENARAEHDKKIDGLQQVQELNVQKAQALEANLDRVEEARAAVNGLIAQGMDWQDIEKLIEMEQSRNNAVAQTIKLPLKLHENTATLLLAGYGVDEEDELADESDSDPSDEDEDEPRPSKQAPKDERLAVDIDLAQSAWANSRQYYDQRKVAASKQDRTMQASTKALKSTEQKINADLKKGSQQEKAVLRPVRKQLWFEKFFWFVSSDGYLVLCGKDAQQTEILYRRHMKKGDVYVHADLPGASVIIIKNNAATIDAPIPPSTLSQAGNLSVCTSSAWESKAIMSAWWVNADQVSKKASTGEYLEAGGFNIQGQRNFLPPAQLLLGLAVLFQVSDESKARHTKHRITDSAKYPSSSPRADGEQSDAPEVDKDDGESDDDFPDANGDLSDDDDFPDVNAQTERSPTAEHVVNNHEEAEDDSDLEEDHAGRHDNPLQPTDRGAEQQRVTSNTNEDKQESDEHAGVDTSEEDSPTDRTAVTKGRTSGTSQPQSSTQKSKKQQQPTRGKRGKAKKMAQKYADQDEEDRELAMALLGSRKAKQGQDDDKGSEAKETPEQARARRREQHMKTQKVGLEAEEMRRLALEDADAGNEDEEAETAKLASIVEGLVGTPLPGDDILEAIPVCAPWSALAKHKYKVKLQPGTQKKGKALREILGRWQKASQDPKKADASSQDTERPWPREAELLRHWKETEIVGILPVKSVKVMMAGGSEGAAKSKGKGGRGGKGGKKR